MFWYRENSLYDNVKLRCDAEAKLAPSLLVSLHLQAI